MSCQNGVPVLHIADWFPLRYNYLINPVFSCVPYYNGNSFRLSPLQRNRGIISVTRRFNDLSFSWIRLHTGALVEAILAVGTRKAGTGTQFISAPGTSVKNRGYCSLRNAQ